MLDQIKAIIAKATNPTLGVALLTADDLKALHKLLKPKKAKTSRNARWAAAAGEAVAALEELQSIQEEYNEWLGNLPENLQGSALGEKLDTVCNIDISGALDAAQEADGADLPQGFGRD